MAGAAPTPTGTNPNSAPVRVTIGERQAVFVDRVGRGTSPEDAARLAGYADPKAASVELLRQPHIRKALLATVEGRLLGEAAPLAVQVALDILGDKAAPASIRGKMAISVLDRVKDKEPAAQKGNAPDLSALTADQLAALVAQMEASGALVVPVDVTPSRTDSAPTHGPRSDRANKDQ